MIIAPSLAGVNAIHVPKPIGGMILKPSTSTSRSFCGMVILYSPLFAFPFMAVIFSMAAVSKGCIFCPCIVRRKMEVNEESKARVKRLLGFMIKSLNLKSKAPNKFTNSRRDFGFQQIDLFYLLISTVVYKIKVGTDLGYPVKSEIAK